MIKGYENLKTVMKTNHIIFWNLRKEAGKDSFLFQADDPDEPIESKFERFETVLYSIEPGKYYFDGNDKKSNRGWFKDTFILLESDFRDAETGDAAASEPIPAVVAGYSREDFESRVREAVELSRLQMKVDRQKELLDEKDSYIKELEKELDQRDNNSPFNRFLTQMEPFIPTIAQRFFGGASAVAAPPVPDPVIAGVPEQPEESDPLDHVLQEVCEIFGTDDPVTFLARLLEVLKANRNYIPIIKSLVSNE